jgi:hypothetical protein
VPAGGDTFMLARSGYGVGQSAASVQAEIMKEASAHCDGQGKGMQVIASERRPAYPTHFPEAQIHFRCVAR